MKTCTKCHIPKERTKEFFRKDISNQDKLDDVCKVCRNKLPKPMTREKKELEFHKLFLG